MKRLVGILLLAALVTACSSSGRSATRSLTKPFPAFDRNDPAASKREFDKVVKNDPNNKYAWYDLGVIAQQANDPPTAETDYKHAIRIDPHFESALYNYGILRYNAGDFPSTITYLRRAVGENGRDAHALWYLGLALQTRRTKAANLEATHLLNAALRIDPTLMSTLKPLGGSGGSGGSGAR